ncbi:MAG: DNA-binding response regulator [Cyanobacteria bacterium SID2]|nr:DNA-binding response regulator [Cyanobacteria bacterium SID2]MBP0006796.1 DNA-binding response regulator [Cyanobacteria bacterium SBC]
MNSDITREILELRERKLTPKQIARKLEMKPSEVTAILKNSAVQIHKERAASGELAPIANCTVNGACYEHFFGEGPQAKETEAIEGARGLSLVFVSRSDRFERYTACTYLVDYWCLGVKDAIPPQALNGNQHAEFLQICYSGYPEGFRDITLEQARAIVFGAVDYAKELGLEPHPDFEKAKAHLGQWDGEPKLEFGRGGKPCFVSGSHDDSDKILKTLRCKVGQGKFDYIASIG